MLKIPSKIFFFFLNLTSFLHFSDFHILDLELSLTGWSKWLRRSSFQFLEIFGIEWNAFDSNERE